MTIEYLGHSFFKLTLSNGTVIATDPYGELYQYPKRQVLADIVTISHHHFDHDGIGSIKGTPVVLDAAGEYEPKSGMRIIGIPTFHDDVRGAKRGTNVLFIIEADGVRVAHAGDLGHALTAEQAAAIGKLDALLLPVGGTYTVDAKTAADICETLSPRMVIPMHYKTSYNAEMNIATVDGFLNAMNTHPAPVPSFDPAKPSEKVVLLSVLQA